MTPPAASSPRTRSAALITGASAGIGKIYAAELAKRGEHDLILVARREDRLQAVAEELRRSGFTHRVQIFTCDLRSAEARSRLAEDIRTAGLEVGLLINNAGFGYVGSFLSDSAENQGDMVVTNCAAPIHLAKLFVPGMVLRGTGAVLNLASVAAYPPIPYMATYGATKAFLLNWSVAVREELRGTGVRMVAVCPGPTESDFHLVAGVKEKIAFVAPMTAEEVVRQSLQALADDRAVVINGWKNTLVAESTRLLPKPWLARLARGMMRDRVPSGRE